jgi:hypothetical protein
MKVGGKNRFNFDQDQVKLVHQDEEDSIDQMASLTNSEDQILIMK